MRSTIIFYICNGYPIFSAVDLSWYLLQNIGRRLLFKRALNRPVKLKHGSFKIRPSRFGVQVLKENLEQLYRAKDSGIVTLHFNGRTLTTQVGFVKEAEEYLCNKQKTWYEPAVKPCHVLDIGGYIGDSALEFYEMGAENVTVVEPVDLNVDLARINLKNFPQTVFVQKAFAKESGPLSITSNQPPGSMGFALPGNRYTLTFEGATLRELLDKDYDLVKMDCEGAESQLLSEPADLIRKVPYWIIETHHFAIKESDLVGHMTQCGFKQVNHTYVNPDCNILHFERI